MKKRMAATAMKQSKVTTKKEELDLRQFIRKMRIWPRVLGSTSYSLSWEISPLRVKNWKTA